MAKFNIEVELDWIDEETGCTIDEEIKEQVVSGVKDALLRKATDEAVQRVDKAIADKILEAEGTIQDTVDKFVETVSQEKIANIMMPTRTGSWSSDVKYHCLNMLERDLKHFLRKRGMTSTGTLPLIQATECCLWLSYSHGNILKKNLAQKWKK